MLKVCGCAGYSIDGKIENGKIKSTVFDVWTIVIGGVLMIYSIFVNFTDNLTLISTNSFIIDGGTRMVTILSIMNLFASGIINSLRRFSIWEIFKHMHEFDKQVRSEHHSDKLKQILNYLLLR